MKKVLIFDFCGTIVSIQSADRFVLYSLHKTHQNLKILRYIFYKIISIFNLQSFNSKQKILMLLKGIKLSVLDNYAKDYAVLLKNKFLIEEVYDIVKKNSNKGNYIVSAGYDIYLKYFFIDTPYIIVSTELEFIDNIFTGFIKGCDCVGVHKVKRISHDIKVQAVYSDSKSDIPLYMLTNNRYLVKKRYLPNRKWHRNLQCKVIEV
jgi:phosphoserine phosphatase